MTRFLSLVVLLSSLAACADDGPLFAVRRDPWRPTTAQPAGAVLSTSLHLYVNGCAPGASDLNLCTAPSALACASFNGAFSKPPPTLQADLLVSVAPCDAGMYAGAVMPGWALLQPQDGGSATVHVFAESLPTASGLAGTIVGTATGGSSNAGPGSVYTSISTPPGFVDGGLKGYLLEITSGAASGCVLPIFDNDGASIIGAGNCLVTPDTTSNYAVRDSINVTLATTTTRGPDAGTTSAGLFVNTGSANTSPTTTANVKFTGIGVILPSGQAATTAVALTGPGAVQFNWGRFINRNTAPGTYAIQPAAAQLIVTNSYVETAAATAIGQRANSVPSRFILSNSMVVGGNIAGPVAAFWNANSAVITNSAIVIKNNVTGASALDVSGVSNSQLNAQILCAGQSNVGVKNVSGTSGMGGEAYLTHMAFQDCGTAIQVQGPQSIRSNASIIYAGTVGTVFDISHGGRVWRQGVCEPSGYSTYLVLDGVTYATCADVADGGPGGDIMSPIGSVFDSFP